MKKSHRSLCAAALCLWSPLLAAQSFSDTRPKVSSAVHPWAKQEVIEDVSPDVLARLAEIRRQREQATRDPGTAGPAMPASTNQAATVATSSPAMISANTSRAAMAPLSSASGSLALNAALPRENAYYVLTASQRSPRFPYSSGDKFRLFLKDTVDPFALMGEAATALYYQAQNEPSAFGGGARGYSRRLGALVGTDLAGEFFGTFLFS